jgi:hypothetical protein
MNNFSGWTPTRIFWRDSQPMVDWAYLGTRRFTDPFFAQTIQPCLRHPADLLFRHQTPLKELGEIAATQPSLRPTGFIFHMSRCGSTLTSQMLAALPANIVLSEVEPIDDILNAHFKHPHITEDQRVQWLRWLVGVLAWQRSAAEKNVFIKFDCWHVMFLPLIQRAFPGVPWIFQYREPVEVMASAMKQLGRQMIPGVLDASLFGWDAVTVGKMSLYEYTARVLAKLCAAALDQTQTGDGKLLNYDQLPSAAWPALMEHWQVNFSAEENRLMLDASQMNAKNPVLSFASDSEAKRKSVPPELRSLTQQWMDGVYQQLEARRRIQGFVSLA